MLLFLMLTSFHVRRDQLPALQPAVKQQEKLIDSILETARTALRSLIQFLTGSSSRHVYTDFTDSVLDVRGNEYTPRGTEFVNCRRKVEAYIRNNQDNIAIHKLKTNRPLTPEDFKVLENILWGEVGTRDDYKSTYGEKPLNLLVREITGLDRTAANEAFSAFLSDHDLTQAQMTFVGLGRLRRKERCARPPAPSGRAIPVGRQHYAISDGQGKKLVEAIKGINENAGLL